MPSAQALHIGLNKVDPVHYKNLRPLRAAVNDALDWSRIARETFGYRHQVVLFDEAAIAPAVLDAIGAAATALQPGDIFLLTYSGHGATLEDAFSSKTGDEKEDQTWCLWDRQLIDDELYTAFRQFRAGVRILVIADCCHSGTSVRAYDDSLSEAEFKNLREQEDLRDEMTEAGFLPREVPRLQAAAIYSDHYDLYKNLRDNTPGASEAVAASVMLFAACQDDQVAFDGAQNGLFTQTFKQIIESGDWAGLESSAALFNRLQGAFRYPKPNWLTYGGSAPGFKNQFPLQIDLREDVFEPAQAPEQPARRVSSEESSSPAHSGARIKPLEYKISIEPLSGKLDSGLLHQLCPPGASAVNWSENGSVTVTYPAAAGTSVWPLIHAMAGQADAQNLDLQIEPVSCEAFPLEPPRMRELATDQYFEHWPPGLEPELPLPGWHLDEQHSQLAAARDRVWQQLRDGVLTKNVRIAQLDTGWYPTHPAFVSNPNIRRDLTRTFVDKESGINQMAIDLRYKDNEQQGHGAGTLGLLAGWAAEDIRPAAYFSSHIGAVPFAETVPLRIADTVLILDSNNFEDAVAYALEIGCEVINLSMGGKPSAKMARAVNKAYERGVLVVAAAGNNFIEGLTSIGPKTVVWPARFNRVVAACGASYNDVPYDFDAQKRYADRLRGGLEMKDMQGNWGPASAMQFAMAAYSPNIGWMTLDENWPIRKTGGGTSAVAPQIAAAAALWIVQHKAELERRGYTGTWKQVEAVRRALFQSADRNFAESGKYYGHGILRAFDALQVPVPDITDNMKAPKAESSLFGLAETFESFFVRKRGVKQAGTAGKKALLAEFQDLLLDDPEISGLELENTLDEAAQKKIESFVYNALLASKELRTFLRGQ